LHEHRKRDDKMLRINLREVRRRCPLLPPTSGRSRRRIRLRVTGPGPVGSRPQSGAGGRMRAEPPSASRSSEITRTVPASGSGLHPSITGTCSRPRKPSKSATPGFRKSGTTRGPSRREKPARLGEETGPPQREVSCQGVLPCVLRAWVMSEASGRGTPIAWRTSARRSFGSSQRSELPGARLPRPQAGKLGGPRRGRGTPREEGGVRESVAVGHLTRLVSLDCGGPAHSWPSSY
jgi:hypothetical protein